MILNILFFIAWTGLVFFIANRRVRELLDIIHEQEERYNDCCDKLKLRSEQNDVLMQTIKILNNAEIDDNVADAVLIGVFAAKTLRRD